MKIINLEIPNSDIYLVGLGDMHIGDKACNIDKITQDIRWIQNNNTKVILMGDILNVATKSSPGKAHLDEKMDTTEQIEYATTLLTPIKDKIIGTLEGNHEFRLSKEGIRPSRLLAMTLNINDLGFSAVINFKVDLIEYIVYATHGSGGAGTKGGIFNKLKKLQDVFSGADLYLRGHSHGFIAVPERSFTIQDNELVNYDRYFIDTGSYLSYDGTYAEQANYQPSINGTYKIHLNSSTKRITPTPL